MNLIVGTDWNELNVLQADTPATISEITSSHHCPTSRVEGRAKIDSNSDFPRNLPRCRTRQLENVISGH